MHPLCKHHHVRPDPRLPSRTVGKGARTGDELKREPPARILRSPETNDLDQVQLPTSDPVLLAPALVSSKITAPVSMHLAPDGWEFFPSSFHRPRRGSSGAGFLLAGAQRELFANSSRGSVQTFIQIPNLHVTNGPCASTVLPSYGPFPSNPSSRTCPAFRYNSNVSNGPKLCWRTIRFSHW